jgi:soluble lytic murein transglycosylase
MRQILSLITVILCLLAAAPCTLAAEDPLRQDRDRFLEARKALDENRLNDYRLLAAQLEDYPLHPYLQYWNLQRNLQQADAGAVNAFISRYADDPLGPRLRRSWLYTLARSKNWKQFLADYREPQPARLQCYRLQALLHTGKANSITAAALELWLVGKSQDKACDPVFAWLDKKDLITTDLLWQRIRLAMDEGNASLAGYLAKRLPEQDRAWVTLWRTARSRPAQTLGDPQLAKDTPRAREIILYALQRIARSDAPQAHRRWAALQPDYRFTPEEAAQLEKQIALSATWQNHPEAHDWLVAVPENAVDTKVREWRIRTALASEDWPAVLEHIEALPAEEAYREEWRYWKSRALEHTGQRLPAMDGLARLAKERDYHAFLAADLLRWPYEMGNQPLTVDPEALEALGKRPGLVRARELYRAELLIEARREWYHATSQLSSDELKLAAELAQQWGWHDNAIMTVARSGDYSDLELRFPLDHQAEIERYAGSYQLKPGHVFAVIRQESAFNKDARSHAGAMGLMQLMPKTGRATARRNNIPLSSTSKLYEPDTNIQIGSAYLRQVMDKYDDSIVLASAAYNAGPHRVQGWLPEEDEQSAASWIALIPFTETRKYVQRVLAYAAIYDWRMDAPVTPLWKHMPRVKPKTHYDSTGK